MLAVLVALAVMALVLAPFFWFVLHQRPDEVPSPWPAPSPMPSAAIAELNRLSGLLADLAETWHPRQEQP